jgi:alpha-D-ribose 1-methylphosphonate 5-triphosphate diphosphatase
MAAAGITTVFDAISCGDVIEGSERLANLHATVEGVTTAQQRGHLRSEHRLHLRCEVSSANILSLFGAFADNPLVGIVSLMDHTPGQRQFVHEDKYMEYYMGKYHFTAAQMVEFTHRQKENSSRYSADHRKQIATACQIRGLTLASHDDATSAHVDEALTLGIHFSEFPTSEEAARTAHAAGIRVLMGAPNVVRGGSHSGNVSAGALAKAGILDVLSSDYVPFSLMHAAFLLSRQDSELDLPAAIATVSAVPAAIVGLKDRGAIALGRRGDLVRVHDDDVPVIRTVWRGGKRIA